MDQLIAFNTPQARKKELMLFILFVVLSSFSYFRPLVWEGGPIPKTIYMVLLVYGTIFSFQKIIFKIPYSFAIPVRLLLLAILGSVIASTVYRGQTILEAIYATEYVALGYIFYFFLVERQVKPEMLETIIGWVAVMFMIAYAISFLIYPAKILQYNETDENRGLQRILLTGDGCLYLFFFMNVNKLLNKFSVKHLIIALICYAFILFSLTRLYIATTALISFLWIFRKQGVIFKAISIGILVVAIPFVAQLKIVALLITKTQEETKDITQYIRYQSAQYYLTTFQASTYTSLFGNGFGYGDKTAYGIKLIKTQKLNNFFIEDLGFIGLYIYMGILAIIAYVWIFVKGLFTKLPYQYTYLKMFLLFLLMNGMTSSATFSEGFNMTIVLVIYLFDAVRKEKPSLFVLKNRFAKNEDEEEKGSNPENNIAPAL